jgi:hypothetical protein
MNTAILGAGIVLGVAGAGFTMLQTKEALAVEGQHWIMLAVILVAGYVLGRIWTQPARMIGLP